MVLILALASVLVAAPTSAHIAKPPRPVLFIHGLASSADGAAVAPAPLRGSAKAANPSTNSTGQDPVPEFYGIYALQDGKLVEFNEKPELNDFGPGVRFVVFMKGLALGMPVRKIFFIPPDKPKDIGDGTFKGWDQWFQQSQAFSNALQRQLQDGVPANAVEIAFRVGPYGGNDEMVRVVPSQELPPGLYQLFEGARFWVRRSEVQQIYGPGGTQKPSRGTDTGEPRKPNPVEPAQERNYPISGNVGVNNKVIITNDSRDAVQVFCDGVPEPEFVFRGATREYSWEVRSTHFVKVVAGSKTFQIEYVVPEAATGSLKITSRGINVVR